ncbi:MAG: hypothetical protein WBC58_11470, partial [Maribacter stanieri]
MSLKYFCYLLVLMCTTSFYAQETYRDNFSSVSYSNNNGSSNFSTNWIETGDTNNGPTSQYIRISSNRLEFNWIWAENIRRSANLNGASTAVLSFNWQAISLTNGRALAIQVSNNGGASYST